MQKFNSLINASNTPKAHEKLSAPNHRFRRFTKSFALNNSRYIAQSKLSSMKSGDSFKGWTIRKNSNPAALGGGNTQAADWDRAKARSLVGGLVDLAVLFREVTLSTA